jgi:hypothetical protein
MFGNIVRQGQPLRDAADLLFSQLMVDQVTSFIRSFDPNPPIPFLEARGYVNTLNEIQTSGPWLPVSQTGPPTFRQLGWPSSQQDFLDGPQCSALNLPLTYFL